MNYDDKQPESNENAPVYRKEAPISWTSSKTGDFNYCAPKLIKKKKKKEPLEAKLKPQDELDEEARVLMNAKNSIKGMMGSIARVTRDGVLTRDETESLLDFMIVLEEIRDRIC